jgi:hypothetical protein
MTDWSKEPLRVSVSAVNYSQLSDEELYARVHDPMITEPKAPAVPEPTKALFYLLLPGEVYPNDVTLGAVYRELEMSLEHRGYFNAVYQKRAGHMPAKIDYLLRVHYGERPWLNPIVRKDRVTWDDDGLVSSRRDPDSMFYVGPSSIWDPRVGMSQTEANVLNRVFVLNRAFGIGPGSSPWHSSYFGTNPILWRDFGETDKVSREFYLFVVEAFKLDDVSLMNRKAPCIWTTFIAVPADRGQKFSNVLRAMIQTATPYFGETTHGLQAYEVPPGKVHIGTPVEVPGAQKLPQPTEQ